MKLKNGNRTRSEIRKNEIKIVAKELSQIESEYGCITPQAVVDRARKASSPLHRFFTWDDTEAAELYRRWEARKLIQSVTVIYDGKDEQRSMRAFVSIQSEDKDGNQERGYYGIVRVLTDSQMRRQLLDRALEELNDWRKRYQELKEFSDLFEVIDRRGR